MKLHQACNSTRCFKYVIRTPAHEKKVEFYDNMFHVRTQKSHLCDSSELRDYPSNLSEKHEASRFLTQPTIDVNVLDIGSGNENTDNGGLPMITLVEPCEKYL